jgi:hypothetical protein
MHLVCTLGVLGPGVRAEGRGAGSLLGPASLSTRLGLQALGFPDDVVGNVEYALRGLLARRTLAARRRVVPAAERHQHARQVEGGQCGKRARKVSMHGQHARSARTLSKQGQHMRPACTLSMHPQHALWVGGGRHGERGRAASMAAVPNYAVGRAWAKLEP